ncbi:MULTISPECIES: acyl carrier protein [unclassified Streptomyces]|uniref:acyl carrier protein n=1 Tax=unclassified Streptomyces TaxID=2593676 RepID=UPI003814F4A2
MSQLPPDSLLPQVMTAVAEVFGDGMGPEDGFFAAGGDSVTAVWLADLLEERLGVDVDAHTVLNAENFRAMAARLADAAAVTTGDVSGES